MTSLTELDLEDVSRDGLGSTRIKVGDHTAAYVYDEHDPDAIYVHELGESHTDGVRLEIDEAREVVDELQRALAAVDAERERYGSTGLGEVNRGP